MCGRNESGALCGFMRCVDIITLCNLIRLEITEVYVHTIILQPAYNETVRKYIYKLLVLISPDSTVVCNRILQFKLDLLPDYRLS